MWKKFVEAWPTIVKVTTVSAAAAFWGLSLTNWMDLAVKSSNGRLGVANPACGLADSCLYRTPTGALALLGIASLIALLVYATYWLEPKEKPEEHALKRHVFTVMVALGAGAVSISIPGSLGFTASGYVATGGLAVFAFVYLFKPGSKTP